MIQLHSFCNVAGFVETEDGAKYIEINSYRIMPVKDGEFGNYNYLEKVFDHWLRFNYPSFWRNPIKYFFGGKKEYRESVVFKNFYAW